MAAQYPHEMIGDDIRAVLLTVWRNGDIDTNERIDEWWDWFAVALFLLITVDILTTIGATVRYGYGAESNPLVRWLLVEGPVVLVGVNLAVVVVTVLCFRGVILMARRVPDPYQHAFTLGVELWLGVVISVGLFLFANNLSVIVLGGSLF